MRTDNSRVIADGRQAVGVGMEQFHHPRPVGYFDGATPRPNERRRRLLTGLAGRVLEIGAGDGLKLACYPAAVDEIVIVESDPFLRAAAANVAAGLPVQVRLLDGGLTRLPVADGSCDAVVCSLVLCRSPRLADTFGEIRRVLRVGGELRFHEHQRPGSRSVALLSALVTPVWSRAMGGCRPARDILAEMERAGFGVEDGLERFRFRGFDHVAGVARPARL